MKDEVLIRDIDYGIAREKIHDYFDYWKAAGSTNEQILSRVAEELSEHDERPLYNASHYETCASRVGDSCDCPASDA